MIYDLPTTVDVAGAMMAIRTDYRVILDIFEVLNDLELNPQEKAEVMLRIFYLEPEKLPDLQAAVDACFWFINCGEKEDTKKRPKLMDWEQDFPFIAAAVNRVYGKDIRGVPYDPDTNEGGLHWWTFMALYTEIGDCYFAQIVRIRQKKKKGEKLDKEEREWYRNNRERVDLKTRYSEAEEQFLAMIGGKTDG